MLSFLRAHRSMRMAVCYQLERVGIDPLAHLRSASLKPEFRLSSHPQDPSGAAAERALPAAYGFAGVRPRDGPLTSIGGGGH
jgi:hypothetical protein